MSRLAFPLPSPSPAASSAAPRWRRVGVWVALAGLLVGCGTRPGGSGRGAASPASRPAVLTSVFPVTALTQAVAGDCAEVSSLIPAGSGPHGYRASPADMVRLGQARLLLIHGLGLETFLDKLVAGAAQPGLAVVEVSAGVDPIPAGASDDGHGHAKAQGQGHADGAHAHGAFNPHAWLDPRLAARQVGTIRDALIAKDPGCAEGYRRRAAAYTARLEALDRRLERDLAPFRGRTLVSQHDVAPYLARRYGLRSTYLVAEPAMSPSPADLRRVDAVVRAEGLGGILVDPGEPPGSLLALVRDRSLTLVPFDPLETAVVEVSAAPEHFLVVMDRNAEALVTVLEGGAAGR